MSTMQIQLLLTFLGYDTGGLDGIPGPKTREAIRDFQEDFGELRVDGIAGEKTQKSLRQAVAFGHERKQTHLPEADSGTFWDEIRYFTREEFACRCGEYHSPYCNGFPVEPEETLVRLADRVRMHFGRPAYRTSGIRCRQHNLDSKGVSNSRHLSGKALDFWIEGVSGKTLLSYVQGQPETRYAYLVDGNIVHMDV